MAKKNILFDAIEYTEEQIQSIKENLKRAFDIDYIPIELKSIFKKHNPMKYNFKIGEEFAFHSHVKNDDWGLKKGWHKLKITYKRGEVIFFKIESSTEPNKERYAILDSDFVSEMIPIEIKLKSFGIPDKNLDILKFEKGKVPFEIRVIKSNDEIIVI